MSLLSFHVILNVHGSIKCDESNPSWEELSGFARSLNIYVHYITIFSGVSCGNEFRCFHSIECKQANSGSQTLPFIRWHTQKQPAVCCWVVAVMRWNINIRAGLSDEILVLLSEEQRIFYGASSYAGAEWVLQVYGGLPWWWFTGTRCPRLCVYRFSIVLCTRLQWQE